jgi:hypothetical protein
MSLDLEPVGSTTDIVHLTAEQRIMGSDVVLQSQL